MGAIDARLRELGIVLPDAPVIKANTALVPGVAAGNLFFCQGTLGHINGEFPYLGKVGDKVSVEEAYQSARLCAINHLAQAKAVLGDLDRILRVVQLLVYVNGAPGFEHAPYVSNGASDLFAEVFGAERAAMARASLSVPDLIYTAPVETVCTFEIQPLA
ncbi:RidA family protein [Acidovorax sp. SUPP2522]|uniref:RidA family protein n=1 Tax=unclassified Acidovorax TaxID=2684926 RepID=UPI00234AE011|nr:MULTISPECIES: RidA family protein [unclassified Acidovorax]WCM99634.1 RidA family protein [Acidovorax sp. GBBC 1281]GKT19067.1 RidA family protein [Acidovorax sp. SUPP2522]